MQHLFVGFVFLFLFISEISWAETSNPAMTGTAMDAEHKAGEKKLLPLSLSGFANITTTFVNDLEGAAEKGTTVSTELDFEKDLGDIRLRLDLDIPATGNEAGGPIVAIPGSVGIEQAKFVLPLYDTKAGGLTLTGGAWNAPIGLEKQDAPDRTFTSATQLFALRPRNLAGFMVSGEAGKTQVDLFAANEWRANTGAENSFGGQFTVTPIREASLAVGFATSPVGNGDIFDVVARINLLTDLEFALELLNDTNNNGYSVTVHYTHGPHGAGIRYDAVDNDPTKTTPTQFTLGVSSSITDQLLTRVEWRQRNPDTGVDNLQWLTLQLVALF